MLRLRNFDEMFDELVWNSYSRWFIEKDGKYEFRITLPGEKKEDVKVWTEDLQLRIETKRKSFSVSLPSDANVEKIEAKLDLGILTVTVEKIEKVKKNVSVQ